MSCTVDPAANCCTPGADIEGADRLVVPTATIAAVGSNGGGGEGVAVAVADGEDVGEGRSVISRLGVAEATTVGVTIRVLTATARGDSVPPEQAAAAEAHSAASSNTISHLKRNGARAPRQTRCNWELLSGEVASG
jgi:hypothetical protein